VDDVHIMNTLDAIDKLLKDVEVSLPINLTPLLKIRVQCFSRAVLGLNHQINRYIVLLLFEELLQCVH
jgi:hypothetical protein